MATDTDRINLNFILSTGRTGSTLLSTMLNMHTGIISVSEEPFAYNLYHKYKDKNDWRDETIREFCYDFYLFSEGKLEPQFGKPEDLLQILKANQAGLNGLKAIKLAYLVFFPLKNKSEVTAIVDKQLKFHSLLDRIVSYYPQSRFIVLYRDPRDNVLVKIRRGIKQKRNEGLLFYAKTWNYEYSLLRQKISKLPAGAYMEVKYEDLVSQPEPVLKSICRFLNLPFEAQMLEYDQQVKKDLKQQEALLGDTVKQHLSLLHEGLTQKPNTDKVGHWRTGLSEKEYNMVWSVCGKTASDIGYKAEGCKPVSFFSPAFIKQWLRFYIIKVLIPGIYYGLPFGMIYAIKKLKYGKNFRNGKWQTRDYYKGTLPNN